MVKFFHNQKLIRSLIALLILYAMMPLLSNYRISCHSSSETRLTEDGDTLAYECPLCYIAVWDGQSNSVPFAEIHLAVFDGIHIQITAPTAYIKANIHSYNIRSPPNTFLS